MWKKISVVLLSFIATFSVVMAIGNEISATETTGFKGTYIGRVGPAGDGLNIKHFKKGDRILSGIKGPNGNDITWLMINDSTLWNAISSGGILYDVPEAVKGTSNGMYAMSYDEITETSIRDNKPADRDVYLLNDDQNNLKPIYTTINNAIGNSVIQSAYALPHRKDPNTVFYGTGSSAYNFMNADYAALPESVINYTFPQIYNEIGTGANGVVSLYGTISNADRILGSTPKDYISGIINETGDQASGKYVNSSGSFTFFQSGDYNKVFPLRIPMLFNMSDVVFAMSACQDCSVDTSKQSNVDSPALPASYTSLYTEAGNYAPMKLRIKDDANLGVSFDSMSIADDKEDIGFTRYIGVGDKVKVSYSGKKSPTTNDYVSVLIEKKNTDGSYKLIQYGQLSKNESDQVIVDTSSLELGDYKLSIVDETITTDNEATYSSSMQTKEFSVINLTHRISYTAASNESYEYKDLNMSDTVGTITAKPKETGASLVYELTGNGDDNQSYKNFEIEGLVNGASANTSLKVKIKSGAPDLNGSSLKPGTYSFCINAKTTDGNPSSPYTGLTEKCTTLTVNKRTVSFDFEDSSELNLAIGANVAYGLITSDVPDVLKECEISYTLDRQDDDLLIVKKDTTNPLKYHMEVASSHSSDGLPTTFTLNASILPNEYFNAANASTERTIFVYRKLSTLTWTPQKSEFYPSNVSTPGSTVGTLKAIDGAGPFVYELVDKSADDYDSINGADNEFFTVINEKTASGATVDVVTAEPLSARNYYLQFKVTDTKTLDSKYVTAILKVILKTQDSLVFKDSVDGTKKIKLNELDKVLVAEGGASDNPKSIQYGVAPIEMQPDHINPETVATIHPTSGLIKPTGVGTIKVQAKKQGNGIYDDITAYLNLTVEPIVQTIEFRTGGVDKVAVGKRAIIDAMGTVTVGGTEGIGGIWYDSSDKNIATIDPITGEVTGISAGSTTLTAVLNKESTKDYTNPNYDPNYETKSISKTITIYTPMTFAWEDANPKVKANANMTGTPVGSINVQNKAGSNPLTATISSSTDAENKDHEYFQDNPTIVGNNITLKLKNPIDAQAHASHQGSFKVQVIITDGNGPQTYNATVLIDPADNKVEFVDADGNVITELTKIYDDHGNKFKLLCKSDSNSASEAITYSAKDSDQDILDVKGTGDVEILKTGNTVVKVHIGESNGYGEVEKEMNVTIKPAVQDITFNDATDPLKVELDGESELQSATAQVVLSDGTKKAGVGDITYKSSNPTVAKIDVATGEVRAVSLGEQVTITATINDPTSTNYNPNYEKASVEKKVQVFTGKFVGWEKKLPNLKAGSTIENVNVGKITTRNTTGTIYYTFVPGADKDMFTLVDNGTTADVKFKPGASISASDLFLHGSEYKCTVNVEDDNGTTPVEVIVTIDDAQDPITFKKDGILINKITEKYGTNNNEFQITAIATSGKAPAYDVTGDKNKIDVDATTGVATIKQAGTTSVTANVPAGNGYEAGTKTIDVEIQKGDQWIAFEKDDISQSFVKNQTFEAKASLEEVTKGNVSNRLITYSTSTPTKCSIDAQGNVTMLETGDCKIKAENKDANWSPVETAEKTINLYDRISANLVNITANLQAETVTSNANAKVGDIQVNGGSGDKSYEKSTSVDSENKDAKYFKVNPTTGIVSFSQAIKAADLVGKYDAENNVYKLYVQVDVSDDLSNVATANCVIEIKGAPLKASFDTGGTGRITEEYALGKTFTIDLSENKGKGIPTFTIKSNSNSPQDVIEVDEVGVVNVLHANDKENDSHDVIVQAVIPANNGYDAETIEVPVEITKAPQPNFAFKNPTIKLGHKSETIPLFNDKLSSGKITMKSKDESLATIEDTSIMSNDKDGTAKITAIDSGDRDYKSATAEATVIINSEPAYGFVISVPSATYGETGKKANIVLNDATGANQKQTWSSSDPSIADIDQEGNITIKKAGSVTISCTQTSTGEPSVSNTATMVIKPKAITVKITEASKYVGEAVPVFSATIPTSDLVGNDTIDQPTFSCKDDTGMVTKDTKVGTYDITGSYATNKYPSYKITVTPNKLTVQQDTSLANWFHVEGVTSKGKLDLTKWINEDVKIVLDSAKESAGIYDELSLDKILWGTSQSISKEGIITSNVQFRIKETKANATPQSTTIKIDKTKPVVKSITGTPAKRNALSQILNSLTFGKYFKPQLEVSITAEDVLPSGVKDNSGLKAIHYNVYQIKEGATLSDPIASGDMKTSDTLKLVDEGSYLVCATADDNAGNISSEICSGIKIQEIGESSDEKELPDINIDVNQDGIADINITRPGEKKPYLNIDTDGDGKPDINISREGEKVIPGTTKPFLNIISPEVKWSPTKEIDFDKDGTPDFRTDSSLEPILSIDSNEDKIPDLNIDLNEDYIPDINIDASGDKIPETNIDSDGDGIADINIDKLGTGKPQERICTTVVWNPTKIVKKDGVSIYGTTADLKPDSKESLSDNGIIIKPSKPGSIFLPNYVLKVNDVTKTLDEKTKKSIIEIIGDKSEVKRVFDISLSDGDKVIQPDGSILVRIPIDQAIKNPRVVLRNEAGIFEEVEVSLEDGYYVFETDYLGTVSIAGDKDETADPMNPADPKEPTNESKTPITSLTPTTPDTDSLTTSPNTSVKGAYTENSGGALTGDNHKTVLPIMMSLTSMLILCGVLAKIRKNNK